MEKKSVRDVKEFRRWVKIRLVEQEISQNELARRMGIPGARISEATHGAGRKMKREAVKERFTLSQYKMEMMGVSAYMKVTPPCKTSVTRRCKITAQNGKVSWK